MYKLYRLIQAWSGQGKFINVQMFELGLEKLQRHVYAERWRLGIPSRRKTMFTGMVSESI